MNKASKQDNSMKQVASRAYLFSRFIKGRIQIYEGRRTSVQNACRTTYETFLYYKGIRWGTINSVQRPVLRSSIQNSVVLHLEADMRHGISITIIPGDTFVELITSADMLPHTWSTGMQFPPNCKGCHWIINCSHAYVLPHGGFQKSAEYSTGRNISNIGRVLWERQSAVALQGLHSDSS